MAKLFISYSRTDTAIADRLINSLNDRGIDAWVDRDNIDGGELWRASISQAIADCDVFLVLLSTGSAQSANVSKELALAESHKRPIVPILLEACTLPRGMDYQLAGLQWIEFAGNQYEQAFERLVKALQSRHSMAASAQAANRPSPPSSSASPTSPSSVGFEPEGLNRLTVQLAAYVGPMARVLVNRAAKRAQNWGQLYAAFAEEVPSGTERERFLSKCPSS